ncbi:HAMP domain-containing protein [candidate division KSB1 bacterium]|nr:HAMP domain-containing protein [candidate division KSB1 bacterium]
MRKFRDLAIKWKLRAIIIVTCGVVLVLACMTFLLYDQVTYKKNIIGDLEILAEIIGRNINAAIEFSDERDAQAVVKALGAEPHIMSACVYTIENAILARYQPDSTSFIPDIPAEPGYQFGENDLQLVHPIYADGVRIGTIYIQADLHNLVSRRNEVISILIIFVVLSIMIVFCLSQLVQKSILTPIRHLSTVARTVSVSKDYSVRAIKASKDEIGFLTDTFNEMLNQIQDRDKDLRQAKIQLEKHARQLQKELCERNLAEKQLKNC